MSTKTMPAKKSRATAHKMMIPAIRPIRPIRSDADYDLATAELETFVLRDDLDPEEQDRFEVLTALVERYDDLNFPMAPDSRSVSERLRSLMESSAASPAVIGDVIGSRPAASMVLKGERELSKAQIRKLADHFKISPAYFL